MRVFENVSNPMPPNNRPSVWWHTKSSATTATGRKERRVPQSVHGWCALCSHPLSDALTPPLQLHVPAATSDVASAHKNKKSGSAEKKKQDGVALQASVARQTRTLCESILKERGHQEWTLLALPG